MEFLFINSLIVYGNENHIKFMNTLSMRTLLKWMEFFDIITIESDWAEGSRGV